MTRTKTSPKTQGSSTGIEKLEDGDDQDIENLCDATNEAIVDGEGFGWLSPPPRHTLEAFWRGVLLVPDRSLYVARMDGTIVGSIQLVKPAANNQAGAFAATLATFFIAPWARGHGLARGLLTEAIEAARKQGYRTLDLDVRADRAAAITLFEAAGFKRWGEKPRYAMVDRKYLPGYYYSLTLNGDTGNGDTGGGTSGGGNGPDRP